MISRSLTLRAFLFFFFVPFFLFSLDDVVMVGQDLADYVLESTPMVKFLRLFQLPDSVKVDEQRVLIASAECSPASLALRRSIIRDFSRAGFPEYFPASVDSDLSRFATHLTALERENDVAFQLARCEKSSPISAMVTSASAMTIFDEMSSTRSREGLDRLASFMKMLETDPSSPLLPFASTSSGMALENISKVGDTVAFSTTVNAHMESYPRKYSTEKTNGIMEDKASYLGNTAQIPPLNAIHSAMQEVSIDTLPQASSTTTATATVTALEPVNFLGFSIPMLPPSTPSSTSSFSPDMFSFFPSLASIIDKVTGLFPVSLAAMANEAVETRIRTKRNESNPSLPSSSLSRPSSDVLQEGDHVVLFFHGGAFLCGSPFWSMYRDFSARLVSCISDHMMVDSEDFERTDKSSFPSVKVVSVQYRLAPTSRFPSPVLDAVAAYEAVLATGVRGEHVVLSGDSAGGNIALSLATALAEGRVPLPTPGGVVLYSPWADLALRHTDEEYRIDDDIILPLGAIETAGKAVFGCLSDRMYEDGIFRDFRTVGGDKNKPRGNDSNDINKLYDMIDEKHTNQHDHVFQVLKSRYWNALEDVRAKVPIVDQTWDSIGGGEERKEVFTKFYHDDSDGGISNSVPNAEFDNNRRAKVPLLMGNAQIYRSKLLQLLQDQFNDEQGKVLTTSSLFQPSIPMQEVPPLSREERRVLARESRNPYSSDPEKEKEFLKVALHYPFASPVFHHPTVLERMPPTMVIVGGGEQLKYSSYELFRMLCKEYLPKVTVLENEGTINGACHPILLESGPRKATVGNEQIPSTGKDRLIVYPNMFHDFVLLSALTETKSADNAVGKFVANECWKEKRK